MNNLNVDTCLKTKFAIYLNPSDERGENMTIEDAKVALSAEDQDILGEIGNITMGTAATTLSAIVQKKTDIDTPTVGIFTWQDLQTIYPNEVVCVRIKYEEGLTGSNMLILKDRDVKIITDLMMGGAGVVAEPISLNDMDMSAISEAMNQMVGASATSLSSMIQKTVNISPPSVFACNFASVDVSEVVGVVEHPLVVAKFRLVVGELIESDVVQVFRIDDGLELVSTIKQSMFGV